MAEDGSALVNFLSDPATLVGLGVVAAGAAYYLSSRVSPFVPPIPLTNQSSEIPVRHLVSLSLSTTHFVNSMQSDIHTCIGLFIYMLC